MAADLSAWQRVLGDDALEEVRVLTATWDAARRHALLDASVALVEGGVPAHAAWAIALGGMLP